MIAAQVIAAVLGIAGAVLVALAIPGMDWTDEIGAQCLEDARKALEGSNDQ